MDKFNTEKYGHGSGRYAYTHQENLKKRKCRKRNRLIGLLLILLLMVLGVFWCMSLLEKRRSVPQDIVFQPDEPSRSIVDAAPGLIPEYTGTDVIALNNNVPNFTAYDLSHTAGETYSDLDLLGRCGTAVALLDRTMMPTEPRGEIGSIKPSGWVQEKYPGIIDSEPPYLYNRSHLIAYAMTGQNANEKNLITGTRYLNMELMQPYEIKVLKYLDYSDNHVLYRVSPYFKGVELVARGVELEAYSVEDGGEGVCFHVFLYNVQPGITITYLTGDNQEER